MYSVPMGGLMIIIPYLIMLILLQLLPHCTFHYSTYFIILMKNMPNTVQHDIDKEMMEE